MRCDEALNRLNARADGELRAEDVAGLEAHLHACAQCRGVAEGLSTIDAELRRALAGRRAAAARLADRTAALVRASAGAGVICAPPAVPALGLAWGSMLVGLAAGFLVAVLVFRPWQTRPVRPGSSSAGAPIARLAVASGPVEVREVSQLGFLRCPEDAPIAGDSVVRTGPDARCEIACEDGNALRLDCNTEVMLHRSEVVEVSRGRLWSTCRPGHKALEIQSGRGTIVPRAAAQFAVECQPNAVRLIVVDGTVHVQTAQKSMEVGAGQHVRIVAGNVEEDPEGGDSLLETGWVNGVLACHSSEHPELVERVHRLLANVGAAKLSLLYEDELRRLGDDGVPPLLAYLASTRGTPDVAQRATAARIVADVAQTRWIADLITLLPDENAEVRFHAARGLERLTGRDQGCEARAWQSQPRSACAEGYQRWLEWWRGNRAHYPAARREILAPTPPPF
jgi:hypothetical protein